MKTAVYPGTFDPITNGHIDVIKKSLKIFDKLIIATTDNTDKNYSFSVNERLDIINNSLFKDLKLRYRDRKSDEDKEKDSKRNLILKNEFTNTIPGILHYNGFAKDRDDYLPKQIQIQNLYQEQNDRDYVSQESFEQYVTFLDPNFRKVEGLEWSKLCR